MSFADTSYVKLYVHPGEDPPMVGGVVTIDEEHSDCSAMLGRLVKLPVRLPGGVFNYTWVLMQRYENEIRDVFTAVAKKMGIKEVVIPRIERCRPTFKRVRVDELSVRFGLVSLFEDAVFHLGSFIVVFIDGVIIPLLWDREGDHEYVNTMHSVLETALFMSMNPWVADALAKTLNKLLGNSPNTPTIVTSLTNVLKLVGASSF